MLSRTVATSPFCDWVVQGRVLGSWPSVLKDFAARSREDGSVDAWFSGCDQAIRGVSSSVNGPALAAAAAAVSYEDMGAVEFFRSGLAC